MLDAKLDARVTIEGGFSTNLSFTDLQRLRKVVKGVHLKNYPQHMLTDYEADRLIDVLAPETQKYLIEKHWAQIK